LTDVYVEHPTAIRVVERIEEILYDLRGKISGEGGLNAHDVIEHVEQDLYDLGVELTKTNQIVRYGDIEGEHAFKDTPQLPFTEDCFRELNPSTLSQINIPDREKASLLASFIAFGLACRYQSSGGEFGTPVLYFNLGQSLGPTLDAIHDALEEQENNKSWTLDLVPEKVCLIDPSSLPIFFYSGDEITTHSVIRFSKMMLRTQGVHLIVIDNLEQVMPFSPGIESTKSNAEILRRLEEMAYELNSEVLVIV
jgi:hypothetical protein